MGDTAYSGSANSNYDNRIIARRGIAAAAGLTALVSATYTAVAEDARPITYKDTNLAQYGVPSVEGLKPYKSGRTDLTEKIAGKETGAEFYRYENGFVAILSVDGKMFGVMRDYDNKRPVDEAYLDQNGDGQFSRYDPGAKIEVPDWAIR